MDENVQNNVPSNGQVNNQANMQNNTQNGSAKPKKKGKTALIITLSVILILIVAVVAIYFLVLSNPKYVFSQMLDRVFTMGTQNYNTINIETSIKPSFDLDDENDNEEAKLLEDFTLNLGMQLDFTSKKEIIDLGIEYKDDDALSGRGIFTNDKLYVYLNDIFDKYIYTDIDNLSEEYKDVYEIVQLPEKRENFEIAMAILNNEIKNEIMNNGTYEKTTDKITLNGKRTDVNKFTAIFTEKEFAEILVNICNNLAENDEFLDCFETSPRNDLKDFADQIEEESDDSDSTIEFSIYTKGLLNEFVGINIKTNIEDDEELSMNIDFMREANNLYNISFSQDKNYMKVDIELEPEKSTRDEDSGKAKIKMKLSDTGKIAIDMDYKCIYNQPIDEIDERELERNSVEEEDLTDSDFMEIMQNLSEKPIIKDIIESTNQYNDSGNSYDYYDGYADIYSDNNYYDDLYSNYDDDLYNNYYNNMNSYYDLYNTSSY